MKFAIVIALALVSVTSFAHEKKAAHKAAVQACKAEGKTKKDLEACVKAKQSEAAPAEAAHAEAAHAHAETAHTEHAPAAK